MVNNYVTQAYIIHRRPYRETSYIVIFFSEEYGKFSAVVRGVKGISKQSLQKQAWLQPFRKLQIGWYEKQNSNADLVSLKQLEPINMGVINLKKDANICGLYINELLYRLLYHRVAVKEIFQDYQQSLQQLSKVINNNKNDMSWILRKFEFNLLNHLGYGFECHVDAFEQPINADKKYLYYPEIGMVPINEVEKLNLSLADNTITNNTQRIEVMGKCILYLQYWQRNDSCLAILKILFRQALAIYLGNKPIMTRQLFQKINTH